MATKRKTPAAQVIDEALAADPKVASTTLARRLYKQSPELWTTFDACRTAVRRQRGAQGKWHRTRTPHTPRPPEEAAACQRWGAVLPDPDESEWRWYDLPEGPSRWLLAADFHTPYHDKKALIAMLSHAEGNCDGVLILGDGPDCYQVSHWQRDARKRSFPSELVVWGQILDTLAMLKPTKVVWKMGNHDFRLERYLMAKAPEMLGLKSVPPGGPTDDKPDLISWESLMHLEDRGIEVIPQNCPIRHHELTLIHGHEWGARFSSPVNPARGSFLKAHECTVEAHSHRTSHHTEPTLRDRQVSCWSIGCLCTLHPEYRPLGTKWNHGFAYLDTGSEWKISNHRIINGEVV